MKIEYSKKFIKDYKYCPKNVKNNFKLRLEIFIEDVNHPLLNNHALLGKLKGYRSINITGDWRAFFKILMSEK